MHKKAFIILFSYFSMLFSIENCLDQSNIQEEFFNDEIIGLYLTAVDFNTGESNILLFDYSLELPSEINQGCHYNNLWQGTLKLEFDISMFIDGYMDTPENVADGEIKIYNIPSTSQELRFRNTDIVDQEIQVGGGATFLLQNSSIYIEDQVDDLTELFLSSGRIPNGIYSFNFRLYSCNDTYGNCDQIDTESKTINIFVPTFLELISPGSNSLADTLNTQIANTYPIFQWNSDYCSDCDFAIRVSEFNPLIHSSLYEALDDYSILPAETGFYSLDNNINVFQFPASGFENLVEGNSYVWQLRRSYETTNGTQNDFSEIFIFMIQSLAAEMDLTGVEDSEYSLENIKLLIGEPKYNQLFSSSGELSNFTSVDPFMFINNENVSINYLVDLIQKVNQNQIEIIEVEVE